MEKHTIALEETPASAHLNMIIMPKKGEYKQIYRHSLILHSANPHKESAREYLFSVDRRVPFAEEESAAKLAW